MARLPCVRLLVYLVESTLGPISSNTLVTYKQKDENLKKNLKKTIERRKQTFNSPHLCGVGWVGSEELVGWMGVGG